jgi:signal transduction protein with GAF and PtsI domain
MQAKQLQNTQETRHVWCIDGEKDSVFTSPLSPHPPFERKPHKLREREREREKERERERKAQQSPFSHLKSMMCGSGRCTA